LNGVGDAVLPVGNWKVVVGVVGVEVGAEVWDNERLAFAGGDVGCAGEMKERLGVDADESGVNVRGSVPGPSCGVFVPTTLGNVSRLL